MNILNLIISHPLEGIMLTTSIIFAIGLHEAAHAYSAYWLGDVTPKYQKRLTLNPFKHLDWIGLGLILVIGLGWGKPVQINPLNFKDQKRDAAIVAFAGPLVNILLTMVSIAIIILLKQFTGSYVLIQSLMYFMSINITLAIFNLLPLEPLDGFKVLTGLLPSKYAFQLEQVKSMSMYVLLFLVITGFISSLIGPLINFFTDLAFTLIA